MAKRGDFAIIRQVMDGTGRVWMARVAAVRDGQVVSIRPVGTGTETKPTPVRTLGGVQLITVSAGARGLADAVDTVAGRMFDSAGALLSELEAWGVTRADVPDLAAWVGEERDARITAEMCEHTPEENGCERRYCNGIPPLGLAMDCDRGTATAEPSDGYETGAQTFARELWQAARWRFRGEEITLPEYGASPFDRAPVREVCRWDWRIGDRAVRVVSYGHRDRWHAVYVDGVRVVAGVQLRGRADGHADQLVWPVVEYLRRLDPDAGTGVELPTFVPAPAPEPAAAEPVAPVEVSETAAPETPEVTETPTPVAPDPDGTPFTATVGRAELLDALAYVGGAVPTRPSVPVLAGVRVDALADGTVRLAGYNLEQSRSVDVSAEVPRPGAALLPWRVLRDWVKSLPKTAGEVSVAVDSPHATLTAGGTRFTVETLPLVDYPTLPAFPPVVGSVPLAELARTVARVAPAVGNDETLPMMLGIHTIMEPGGLRMRATDRYRLALATVGEWAPVDSKTRTALIPGREFAGVVKQLSRVGKGTVAAVEIGHDPTGWEHTPMVGFRTGGRSVVTRTIDSQSYPPVEKLVPEATAYATVDAGRLAAAVARAAVACERDTPVRLEFAPGEVTVTGGGGDGPTVAETVPCEWDGPVTLRAFNPQYLTDALNAVGSATVTIGVTADHKPVTFRGDDPDAYTHVIQPIKVVRGDDKAAAAPEPAAVPPAGEGETETPAPADDPSPAPEAETPEPAAEVPADADPAPAPEAEATPGAGNAPEDPERIAQRAWEALQEGRWADALAAIGDGEAAAPGHLVAGSLSWDRVRAEVIRARDAAEPTPEPAPAGPVDGTDPGEAPTADPAAEAPTAPEPVDAAPAPEVEPVRPVALARVIPLHTRTAPAPPPEAEVGEPAGDGSLVFTLAPFSVTGLSYRAGRSEVRKAAAAAGLRVRVVKDPAGRRRFRVECAPADRGRVASVVAGAVRLDTAESATSAA